MKTIRIPKKNTANINYFLTYLSDKLPKANYDDQHLESYASLDDYRKHLSHSEIPNKDSKRNPLYKYGN